MSVMAVGRATRVAGWFLLAVVSVARADASDRLASIRLPPGFHISVWARNIDGARSMTWGERGTLFVGTRDEGKVYAVRTGVPRTVVTIAQGLERPNGVAFRTGALYVAEVSRVLRFDDIEAHLDAPPKPAVVTAKYPTDRHHGWKFIRFGPDGALYVPVGAPCNVCERPDPYASITRLDVGSGAYQVIARGVRNTVGFDWHPKTHALWFTDNGRDSLGDDVPPDELNVARRDGLHFGFPYLHGKDVKDPEFWSKRGERTFTPPAATLGPHVAALGMRFYRGSMFPPEYRDQIFIAEHGSWDRSQPIGYRVSLVRLDGEKVKSYEPFAEGWLDGRSAWGRPVDVEITPDGALLVSDDKAGVIYRIAYRAP
jgi:glucose/arabinose dehydrogenase